MASSCQFLTTFPGSPFVEKYYCRADVTAFVSGHPGMFNYNGAYTVGDVEPTRVYHRERQRLHDARSAVPGEVRRLVDDLRL